MFNCFEVIHFAGAVLTLRVDACAHLYLHIDATVVSMGLDGLGHKQNSDAEQAQAAKACQNRVGMCSHHLTWRQLLLIVVSHVIEVKTSILFGWRGAQNEFHTGITIRIGACSTLLDYSRRILVLEDRIQGI